MLCVAAAIGAAVSSRRSPLERVVSGGGNSGRGEALALDAAGNSSIIAHSNEVLHPVLLVMEEPVCD